MPRVDSICVKSGSTYSHSNLVNIPIVLFNFEHFYCVVDLLLSTAEETAKSVYEFIINCAGRQIVAFVFHRSCLNPLVFGHDVLLYRVQSLLSTKTTEHKHVAFAKRYGVGVS